MSKTALIVGAGSGISASFARLLAKDGDTPLSETGELRDSIQYTVHGYEGAVGSDNDKALWHELSVVR
jgi:NAD(P)-dependent dehydrogenase (short-subunit alcohol dehydrogenase family)